MMIPSLIEHHADSAIRSRKERHLESLVRCVIPPLDLSFLDLAASEGFGRESFSARRCLGYLMLESYSLHLSIAVLNALQITSLLRKPQTVDEILSTLNLITSFRVPL